MKYIWIAITIGLVACNSSKSSTQTKVEDRYSAVSDTDCQKRKEIVVQLTGLSRDTLTDGSQIYWSYDCDSSWLTLENKNGKKYVFYSLEKEMMELTTRIGHVHFTEFSRAFLYTNKVISGCCEPLDYYLYNKEDASLIKYLGRAIFVGKDATLPYFVSYPYSGYREEDTIPDLNQIVVTNLNTLKSTTISMPKYVSENIINTGIYSYPEQITKTNLNQYVLTLQIPYAQNPSGKEKQYKITIDLKKY